MRALIVDDEPLGRDCVRLALGREEDVTIVGECGDGEEAIRAINEQRPDIVFLDIQMPGLDGFGVIERLGTECMPLIVFVTAYDAHALRAFGVHAFDYLLKPFDDERFREAMARARTQRDNVEAGEFGRRLRLLLTDVRAGDLEAEPEVAPASGRILRFAVKEDERLFFVRAVDVDYFEAAGNYVRLHVKDRQFEIRATLRTLAAKLDPARFVRVHKSAIVNIDRVREVQAWFGGDYVALLHSGARVRVSRKYAKTLLRTIQ
jgi:two-component system LytT family response regulator